MSNKELIAIGAALAAIVVMLKNTGDAIAEVLPDLGGYDDLYKKHAAGKSFDWKLLKAVAIVESGERPGAQNPSDPSYGICQVLCQPDGAGGCKNKLNIVGWPPDNYADLFDPDINLYYAAQILDWNIRTYGEKKGVAVYNSWAAHLDPADGPFVNQDYVDKVFRALSGLT